MSQFRVFSCCCTLLALVAFETARYLRLTYQLDVPVLVFSSMPNPNRVTANNTDRMVVKRKDLDEEALLRKLADMGEERFVELYLQSPHSRWIDDALAVEESVVMSGEASGGAEEEMYLEEVELHRVDVVATFLPSLRADFAILDDYGTVA